jgi:hypothetical protein
MSAGAEPGEPHPKSEKKKIFLGVKSWFFTRNTSKIFAPPSAIADHGERKHIKEVNVWSNFRTIYNLCLNAALFVVSRWYGS